MNLYPPIIWFIPTHEQIYTHPIFGRQIYDKFLLCTFYLYFYDFNTLYLTLYYRSWRAATHLYDSTIYYTHKTPPRIFYNPNNILPTVETCRGASPNTERRVAMRFYCCIIYRTHKTPLTCNAIFRNHLLANVQSTLPKIFVVYNTQKNAEKQHNIRKNNTIQQIAYTY